MWGTVQHFKSNARHECATLRDTMNARHCECTTLRLFEMSNCHLLHPCRSCTFASSSRTIKACKSFATRPAYRTHPLGWLPETGMILHASQSHSVRSAVAMSAGSQGTIQILLRFTRLLSVLVIHLLSCARFASDFYILRCAPGSSSGIAGTIAYCIVHRHTASVNRERHYPCALSHCHISSGIILCASHHDCSSVTSKR